MLKIEHDVRSPFFRSPVGPVPEGSLVRFRVRLKEEKDKVNSVRLFYLYGLETFKEGYVRLKPVAEEEGLFECQLQMDEEAGLFFYWFEVRLADRRYRWAFPDPKSRGMTARTLVTSPHFKNDGTGPIPGFQITVYQKDFRTPDWMKGAVLYQIFPDRFNRGANFVEEEALAHMDRPERIWHRDWDEEVDIEGKGATGYLACDFFGGRLEGILEKLPYLVDMGVTVLYLNPVFKAQSNHRYDTGDYLTVDPLLGENEDLVRLFREADRLGIRVILDGVFSHTGADSLYFNRYGRYDSPGAWQEVCGGEASPYTSWYRFEGQAEVLRYRDEEEGGAILEGSRDPFKGGVPYECWWDFPSLPNVEENDLTYRRFICGPQGVLASWIQAGCAGFRLDVSDELPDSFLRLLRKRVKAERADALVMGEIWEDPTAKISYGGHRDFLFGRTHDCVMGYTFQKAVIAFLTRAMEGEDLALAFDRILAMVPKEALYAQMNLLGSHDTTRIITELAGAPKPGTRKEQMALRLTPEEREKGEKKVLLASILQLAFPGATAIYYGDEIGMEGYDDPFNRRTFPWDQVAREKERDLTKKIRSLARLKKETPLLRTGHFETLYARKGILVFRRFLDAGGLDAFSQALEGPREALILLNRDAREVSLPPDLSLPPLAGFSAALYLDGQLVLNI